MRFAPLRPLQQKQLKAILNVVEKQKGFVDHAPNRANMRADIFQKDTDYQALEKSLHEGLQIHQIELFSFQLMPNHDHLVLRPLVDREMSRFMSWIGTSEPDFDRSGD